MITRPTRAARLLTVALVGAVLLGGCAGSGDGRSATGSGPVTPTTGAASPGPSDAGSATPSSAGTAPAASASPKPGATTGGSVIREVSKKAEKKYLDGKVDKGVYVGAVLEAGYEVCARLRSTFAADPAAVVSELIGGELKNAEDAIRYLCPELKPQLAAAAGGFGDGQLEVAADAGADAVARGSYVAIEPGPDCAWSVLDSKGVTLVSGSTAGGDAAELELGSRASSLVSSGCYAWRTR